MTPGAIWTVEYREYISPGNWSAGVTKAAAAWGISGLTRNRQSLAVDTVSFSVPGGEWDADPVFAPRSILIVLRDGVRWFYGRVDAIPFSATAAGENQTYTVRGVWHELEQLVFRQQWLVGLGEDAVTVRKSRVILGSTATVSINTSEALSLSLGYAIDCGVHIAVGSLPVGVSTPSGELKDPTVAELIQHQVRWMPDCQSWIDYSTEPYPTIHFARRVTAEELTLDVTQTRPSSIQITPRVDLQVPGVMVIYERGGGGDNASIVETQVAPPGFLGTTPGGLVMTIDLQAPQSSYQTQSFDVSAIAVTSLPWWKEKCPWLASASIDSLSFDVPGTKAPNFANEVTGGAVPSWLTQPQQVTCTAKVKYNVKDGDTVLKENETAELSCVVMGTSSAGGSFSHLTSWADGDPVPPGLAESFWSALQELQYEGSLLLEFVDPTEGIHPGQLLNLTGSRRAAFSTMRAQIQVVTDLVDMGQTTINFGPADHLSPSQMVEFLRASRGRNSGTAGAKSRDTGQTPSGATSGVGATPQSNATSAPTGSSKQVWTRSSGAIQVIVDSTETSTPPNIVAKHDSGAALNILVGSSEAKLTQQGPGGTDAPKVTIVTSADSSYILIEHGDKSISLSLDDMPEGALDVKLREVDWCDPDDPTVPKKCLLLCSEPYEAAEGE